MSTVAPDQALSAVYLLSLYFCENLLKQPLPCSIDYTEKHATFTTTCPDQAQHSHQEFVQAELELQQAEKVERVKQQRAQQWLQTQAARSDRGSESVHFLPEISSDILNGGRVQLVGGYFHACEGMQYLHSAVLQWVPSPGACLLSLVLKEAGGGFVSLHKIPVSLWRSLHGPVNDCDAREGFEVGADLGSTERHASGSCANNSLAAQPCNKNDYPRRNSLGHASESFFYPKSPRLEGISESLSDKDATDRLTADHHFKQAQESKRRRALSPCASCADIWSRICPPTSSRVPPLCGALCVAADTWNASRPVEALPLYCVFEKLCTDPQVERNGPLLQLTHNSPAQT
ncbi:hypothetical protein F7725_023291 [Dissostichus mawsoni]|uniref:Uncharacterized protein n=1 Tax=Dissostichus mawsoni TaxID=36200 RepID=A0A7J5Z0R4_DISMA|nr:hypothetical protein F7725_023291 [Dissostichus mawsoni]